MHQYIHGKYATEKYSILSCVLEYAIQLKYELLKYELLRKNVYVPTLYTLRRAPKTGCPPKPRPCYKDVIYQIKNKRE